MPPDLPNATGPETAAGFPIGGGAFQPTFSEAAVGFLSDDQLNQLDSVMVDNRRTYLPQPSRPQTGGVQQGDRWRTVEVVELPFDG